MIQRYAAFQLLLATMATFFISACDMETGESSAQAASRQAFLEKRNWLFNVAQVADIFQGVAGFDAQIEKLYAQPDIIRLYH